MGKKTNLEWTDATWNFMTGCRKVSEGCKFCYAKRDWANLAKNKNSVYYGREFEDVMVHEERLNIPLNWNSPKKIFVNSLSDLFIDEIGFDIIDKAMAVMVKANWHTFQILTKRAERMAEYFNGNWKERIGYADADTTHIWIGVSVESEIRAKERIPALVSIGGFKRFLSMEPLLAEASFIKWADKLDWIIVGGESGNIDKARPLSPKAVRRVRDECLESNTPLIFKQWGEWSPEASDESDVTTVVDGFTMAWVGRRNSGCSLDGVEYKAFPDGMVAS